MTTPTHVAAPPRLSLVAAGTPEEDPCPPSGPSLTTRVVIGVDDSDASMRALQWAARFAPTLGDDVEIEVVVVVGYPEWFYDPDGHDPEGDARTVVRTVFGTMPPATVHIAVEDGDPVTRLLQQSRDATLLVVGSRRRPGGIEPSDSVGLRVAALATCPVLVVH